MTDSRYNPGLHRIALLLAVATFPLIFIGGLVTSHGAGLAVPDWPNSFGYNMFLFPPSQWVGNIWYEHVHRLYASCIGLLSIVLCAWAWKTEQRKSVRWLATAVLGAVIFQGVLGGLRVIWINLDLAVVHGCFAQAFFCLTVLMVLVTSRWWIEAPDLSASVPGRRLIRLAALAVVIVYGQLVVGAVMRHYQAGLAIPDFPLAYGHLLPPTSQKAFYESGVFNTDGDDISDWRSYPSDGSTYAHWMHWWEARRHSSAIESPARWDLFPTLGKIWLHFGHRIGAAVVSVTLLWLATTVGRFKSERPGLLMPAVLLICLLLTQLTLGALTVLLHMPADIASAHVAVGALVLVTTFVLAARSFRLYAFRRLAVVRGGFEPVIRRNDLSPSPLYSGERAGVRG